MRILPDPWLPFIPFIDSIPPVLFQRTLQTVFLISAIAIVLNRRVQLSSLVLGSTMLIAIVSSKAYYGNNKTFCGLMLFLVGLYQPGGPNFLRWQLAITYFGAGLNKALDVDWHTGVFFENWAAIRLRQPWYLALDSRLPPLALGKFMCWSTIVTELGIVPCILIPKLYSWAIIGNVLFQVGLLLFTGATFTLFFYAMTAASLAFVTWPADPVPVLYDSDRGIRTKRFFEFWDQDGVFLWTPGQSGARSRLHLAVGSKVYSGFRALRMIVLLSPMTYFVIASAIAAAGELPGSAAVLYRRLIVAACLVLLMPPLAWIADAL